MEVGFLYWFELDMSNNLGKKSSLPALASGRALPFPPGPGGALGPVNAPQLRAASGRRRQLGRETPTPPTVYTGAWETGLNLFLGGHWGGGRLFLVNLF